jgi:hypothetical protein
MNRRHVSTGVRKLNLPTEALDELERLARTKRAFGSGTFSYQSLSVLIPSIGQAAEIVACVFDKPLRQSNIVAKPGDVSLCLRSEWNEMENSLG